MHGRHVTEKQEASAWHMRTARHTPAQPPSTMLQHEHVCARHHVLQHHTADGWQLQVLTVLSAAAHQCRKHGCLLPSIQRMLQRQHSGAAVLCWRCAGSLLCVICVIFVNNIIAAIQVIIAILVFCLLSIIILFIVALFCIALYFFICRRSHRAHIGQQGQDMRCYTKHCYAMRGAAHAAGTAAIAMIPAAAC